MKPVITFVHSMEGILDLRWGMLLQEGAQGEDLIAVFFGHYFSPMPLPNIKAPRHNAYWAGCEQVGEIRVWLRAAGLTDMEEKLGAMLQDLGFQGLAENGKPSHATSNSQHFAVHGDASLTAAYQALEAERQRAEKVWEKPHTTGEWVAVVNYLMNKTLQAYGSKPGDNYGLQGLTEVGAACIRALAQCGPAFQRNERRSNGASQQRAVLFAKSILG